MVPGFCYYFLDVGGFFFVGGFFLLEEDGFMFFMSIEYCGVFVLFEIFC